ncbi:MAG: regulatory iron-sulfur-containing complex subunit RicT [Desulfobulbaceae bacterium]|nr:regulatory iron-sulfur-containing complex subunit RicT [Desulfobulbaceae bacterium]
MNFYLIRFRPVGQEFTAKGDIDDFAPKDVAIVQTDHGLEPALIVARSAGESIRGDKVSSSFEIMRKATKEEIIKFEQLPGLEQEAHKVCRERIEGLRLPMSLVRVERFFNGSKLIFYFTADSRVDFRELVKDLVQVFRTRVEMRQIGVRHETQMTGGIGPCGRELCCSSFLQNFESVSIKMAKMQDLPLNPSKISGLCNRLLCCLTYEYEGYRSMKKGMPRIGKWVEFEGTSYRVMRHLPLHGKIAAQSKEGEEITFSEEQWREMGRIHRAASKKQVKKK